jgi:hypothetical protein
MGTGLIAGVGRPARAMSINPRSSWAIDRPPKGALSAEEPRFLLVHHSASRNGHNSADAPAILRSFFDFHTGPEKGWNDIAYNFLIDSQGGIWEGRAGSLNGPVAGDATGGNQGFSQLVCLIGDFNAAQPTAASKQSLAALLAWLANRYGISSAPGARVSFTSRGSNRWPAGSQVTTPTITGHRDMSQTTCPGSNLYSYVTGALSADVNLARGGGSATSSPSTTIATPATTPSTIAPSVVESSPPASATTSTVAFTTIAPDPFPTISLDAAAMTPKSPTTTQPSPTSTEAASTSTSIPVVLAAEEPAMARSPLIWGGAAVAGIATALLGWRHRRMAG